MPSRPNVARTKTIRKRKRRELPAMYRNPRAGTWRDPATPSERSITFEAPVLLDANGRWGLHRSDGLLGGGVGRVQGHQSGTRPWNPIFLEFKGRAMASSMQMSPCS